VPHAGARRVLETYRSQICSFNDDIQGTACITLAALLAALKYKKHNLADQRILFLGAGEAGTGEGGELLGSYYHLTRACCCCCCCRCL
jgi:malic enzyme